LRDSALADPTRRDRKESAGSRGSPNCARPIAPVRDTGGVSRAHCEANARIRGARALNQTDGPQRKLAFVAAWLNFIGLGV
jgi:hypothetical protein